MPVHAHQVPLDTAKSWAKQLAKTSKTLTPDAPWPLSRCQKAVAQMLGFDHWHALEKGLAAPKAPDPGQNQKQAQEQAQEQGPYSYRGDLPVDQQGWQALWRDVLDKAQDVHLEFRPSKSHRTIRILLHMHGRLVPFLSLAGAGVAPAIQSLFEGASEVSAQELLDEKVSKYVNGVLALNPREGQGHYRYHALPVHPGGWDMVVRQQGKHLDTWDVSKLDLPTGLAEALVQICRRPTGLVLFTGTSGSGKSTLMKAMAREAYAHIRPPSNPAHPTPGLSREGKAWVLDAPITARDLSGVKHLDVYAPHKSMDNPQGVVPMILRSDADLVIMGELRNKEQAQEMNRLLQSGVSVWATVHASGASNSALERLDDFLPGHDWSQADGLQGWTYSKLLPVLCRYCSKLTGNGQERAAGSGCGHCGMLGVSGRQLIVGLWEMVDGQPKTLFSHAEQARDLVAQGRVSREDAENLLGPLG